MVRGWLCAPACVVAEEDPLSAFYFGFRSSSPLQNASERSGDVAPNSSVTPVPTDNVNKEIGGEGDDRSGSGGGLGSKKRKRDGADGAGLKKKKGGRHGGAGSGSGGGKKASKAKKSKLCVGMQVYAKLEHVSPGLHNSLAARGPTMFVLGKIVVKKAIKGAERKKYKYNVSHVQVCVC